MESVAIEMGLNPHYNRRIGRLQYMYCPACWSEKAYIIGHGKHGWPMWGCFTCRRSGDVITLVRLLRPDWRFPQVVKFLSEFKS
jgi:hypothetical protein